jgi:hypothetical protein
MLFYPSLLQFDIFYVTYSRRKWILIGTCLFLELISRFLDMLIALVFSWSIKISLTYLTCVSCRVLFIQMLSSQHSTTVIHFSYVVDKYIEDYFFLNQYTKKSPK